MRSFGKLAVSILCVAAIYGATVTWQAHKTHSNEVKLAETARTYREHAENGEATAQTELGDMYYHGEGVPQDYGEALRWYRKAADQGNANAQYGLGAVYYHGHGVAQDYGEALRWYRKAADQGNANAENALGLMYYQGIGLPQDYAEALRWFRKGAEQGYAKAQYNLGNMYYYGRGLPRNRADAVNWYRKAADQGDQYALRALSGASSNLTRFFILAELLAGIWLALDFVSFPPRTPVKESLRDFRQKVITATGLLGVLSAGLYWYGYTHYKIRCLGCGFSAFTLFRWLLDAVLIALLVYIIRTAKRPRLVGPPFASSK